MPLYATDYLWDQTSTAVSLKLDLKSGSRQVDFVCSNSYVKVNFRPYIFEIFLKYPVKANECSNVVDGTHLKIVLIKENPGEWDSISKDVSKKEAKSLRKQALRDIENLEKANSKYKIESRVKRDRLSVSKQIELNELEIQNQKQKVLDEKEIFFKEDKQKILDEKEFFLKEDKHKILDEKENFFKEGKNPVDRRTRFNSTCSDDGGLLPCERGYDGDGEDSMYYSSTENIKAKVDSSIRKLKKKDHKVEEVLPEVRGSRVVKIKFTPRKLPTPQRESTAEQDALLDYKLSKQQKLHKGQPQENLEYFKKKAAELFKTGDYEGSASAYASAINLSPFEPALYSNRATCHLALNTFDKVLSDCSHALRLLNPPTSVNAHSRVLALVRRGTAYLKLCRYHQAYSDYKKALQLQPMNKDLARDAERVRQLLLESSSDNMQDTSDMGTDPNDEDDDDDDGDEEDENSDGNDCKDDNVFDDDDEEDNKDNSV